MDRVEYLLSGCASVSVCPSPLDLYEDALVRQEACLSDGGQICVATGKYTGRAADDKYIVHQHVDEFQTVKFGPAGSPISSEKFNNLIVRVQAYIQRKHVYVVDFVAGPFKGRVVTEHAWQALFASHMLKTVSEPHEQPDLTIVAVPGCTSGGEFAGFKSDTAIACDLVNGLIVICGTAYAGEIKKSVFTYAAWKLPLMGELPMHASATDGDDGTALFFGLSGTGKTTLSSDPIRQLVGDDEHSWSDSGVYNIEAGCYAKAINLSAEAEPAIYAACNRFMTVLENVVIDLNTGERKLDFSSSRLTENTRAAYPLGYIPNALPVGTVVKHPKNIIMLTCDAFGVVPAVSKLSNEAAVYHFLSGYTAKVAGTEVGVKEPKATFSTCFGAPFMAHQSYIYADLLMKRLEEQAPNVWLVNTGWWGGPYGTGKRFDIAVTRIIIRDILNGSLANAETVLDPVLNLHVVKGYEQVWPDVEAYAKARDELAELFTNNSQQTMHGSHPVASKIIEAGPRRVG